MNVLSSGLKFSVYNTGRLCYSIDLGNDGAVRTINDIFDLACNFNYIEISGNIYDQKIEVKQLIDKLNKNNDKLSYSFISDGKKSKLTFWHKIKYFVLIDYDYSYSEKDIEWFNQSNASFIFKIDKETDFEYVNSIVTLFEIRRDNVYCLISDVNSQVLNIIKLNKYNILLNVESVLNEQ